ncbi:LysR family transcriptional regulator [Bordetella holmesii]|uniref:LysR substrate-binding domain protein n=2 Tax=Bordetella holmesii TaxID=35814 RepID=A0A158M5L1_9BORD|nr:LysR family transcriptional regulator [Bordetella holmesii]AHV92331.1 bacterial regulatory helix-turn-helix, lysR family protein [Bordetella holmesii ATCC 51541]AIT28438.1 bacterial regulatory helix-turn-helix, lysR family protein [Bordetella holmesii 44057]EWM41230.1 bacterial regulatory helix-turn-helix, lysR family protein [Bordetella holmesii 35009]EWM43604.1 bacterial regulatory helix-turn-helix, lysR family protein [Bordetella holmesii 41130]EWM45121.1 bacterial regulatory helix-turn-
MNVSTRQLRAFVSAADQQNFTRAATEIGLSQPAFSALIKSLEEELDAQLFVRNTRNIELSPFGKLFESFARRSLNETTTALQHLQDYAAGRIGSVQVAALPSVAASWLPPVFRQFRTQYPGVTTVLRDGMSQNCVELLAAGDIDFAIATEDRHTAKLERQLLWQDQLHLVCPPDHPLARQRKRVTLEQIVQYPIVNFVSHSSVRQHVDAAFSPYPLNTVLEVEHLATASAMVESGVGLTIVPSLTLYQFRRPSLAIVPIEDSSFKREVFILTHKNKLLALPARAMRDMVIAHVAGLKRGS